MDEQYVTHIELHQYHSSSSYSERETAVASHLSVGAIRHLHALGLIEGKEADGEVRYTQEEVVQLRRIRRLQRDLVQYPLTDRRNEENLTPLPKPPDMGDSNGTMPNMSSGFALGVNLAGVEVILRLLKRIERLQDELEQERNQIFRQDDTS